MALPVEHPKVDQSTKEGDIEGPDTEIGLNVVMIAPNAKDALRLDPQYRRWGLRNPATNDTSCEL